MDEPIGTDSPPAPKSGPPRSLTVIAALAAAAALGLLLSGPIDLPDSTTTVPTSVPPLSYQDPAVTTVEAFMEAFNTFDREGFIGRLVSEPIVLQWPTSLVGYEGSLRDGEWFLFQRELQSHITLTDCESRAPSGAGTELYEAIVDCNAALADRLISALGEDAVTGRLSVGVADGRVNAVFWEEIDRAGVVATSELIVWMAEYQPHLVAHWMGGATGSPPVYGTGLAEVLLSAAAERRGSDEGPPSDEKTDQVHPAPTAGHSMAVVPDDGRVYLIAGRAHPFVGPAASPIWELTAQGTWRSLPGLELTLVTATLTYVDSLDTLVVVAVVDPENPSLVAFAVDSGGDWEELDRLPLSAPGFGWFPVALSSAYNDTSDQIAVVGWPPVLGLYDVSGEAWAEDASPWVGRSPSSEESRPCLDPPFTHDLSVAFDPASDTFVIAAGSDLCAYNPDGATVELIVHDYGPQDTHAIAHDPVGGLFYIIGDGQLWSYDPDTGSTQGVGPLPPNLLWRNVDMAAQPRESRILVFDGASLWSYNPTNGAWSNLDRTD